MQLLLQRLETDGERLTTSALFVGRTLYGFVPEDPPREVKVKGQTRIPAGRYRLTLEDSPKFTPKSGHKMITVNGVPGFEGISRSPSVSSRLTVRDESFLFPNMLPPEPVSVA